MALVSVFVLCFLLFIVLVAQISSHHRRLEALEMKIQSMDAMFRKHLGPQAASASNGAVPKAISRDDNPLAGVRIGIQIDHDSDRPMFSRMLRDRFSELDALPRLIAPKDDVEIATTDLLIRGRIRSAGYEEMFFEAVLECLTPDGPLLSLTERPPHGDKLSSLSANLVGRLLKEYEPHSAPKGSVYAPESMSKA